MPTAKLTQRYVESLPQTEKLTLYFDTGMTGFGVYTKGKIKTYFVQARAGKKLIKMTIGRANIFSLDDARRDAKDKLALMAKGIDPIALKKQEQVAGITLEEAFKQYCETRSLKPRTVKTYDDLLRLYMSDWLTKPLGTITKELVAQRHKKVGEDAGEAASNNLMRTFRALYNYARTLSDGAIAENPVQRLSQTRQWYKVERRRTFLKPHELKPWYDAAIKIENPVIRDYLFLTLFTGLRKQEGLQLKWSDVDMRDRSLTVPQIMAKNSRPHTLPMSNFLYALFEQLQTRKINEYVFPGSGAAGHLVEPVKQMAFITTQTQYAFNGVATKADFEKKLVDYPDVPVEPGVVFCLHDLRRTFITIAESLDIPYAALKRLLNHSDGNDVTGGYLQITTDRLREPMERISTKLLELMLPTTEQQEEVNS